MQAAADQPPRCNGDQRDRGRDKAQRALHPLMFERRNALLGADEAIFATLNELEKRDLVHDAEGSIA